MTIVLRFYRQLPTQTQSPVLVMTTQST